MPTVGSIALWAWDPRPYEQEWRPQEEHQLACMHGLIALCFSSACDLTSGFTLLMPLHPRCHSPGTVSQIIPFSLNFRGVRVFCHCNRKQTKMPCRHKYLSMIPKTHVKIRHVSMCLQSQGWGSETEGLSRQPI